MTSETSETVELGAPRVGYAALVRVPSFARVYLSLLLGRIGGQIGAVAMILFVLARFHSPSLAGATAFLVSFPGLLMSPVAGALLDRYGRVPLVIVDYLVAALTIGMIAALSLAHVLTAPLLLVIVALSSLTGPLSWAGARSLFPILVPRHLWERANALDSSGHLVATLVGAPVAGTLVAVAGPEWGIAASAALFAIGAAALLGVRDPGPTQTGGRVLTDAWRGLTYVLRNPTLRGIALTLSIYNLSWGCLNIAVPVAVLGRLHQSPAAVGYIWGAMGVSGLASALIAGRMKTEGRERQLMVGSMLTAALATAILPFAGTVFMVALAVVLIGISNGPFDIGLFTLRQRRTDPAWFGRVFAVSMSSNSIGMPIGSALAGPLISWSLNIAFWAAMAAALVAAWLPLLTIPAADSAASKAVPGG